jgi:riboflavin biosynthesis pyrimidine reductase
MEEISYRQLLPEPGVTDALSFVGDLRARLSGDATSSRPYAVANFVSSADGHATVEGRSGKLGDDGDKDLFRALREVSDAVMAGTVTLRAERYGRALPAEERRQRRVSAGLSAEPLTVTVSRSGEIPEEIPLFSDHESEVVVFSPQPPPLRGASATVHHEPLYAAGGAPLTDAFKVLYRKYNVELLLCEGGPTLFNALLHEGLVDELFLTISPKLVGGSDGPGITSGVALVGLEKMRLSAVLERDDALFLRYRLR